jgi:hypothetical protein
MLARLSAKAILLAIGLAMAFFGVGLLGVALATSLIALFGLPGAYAIAGGVLLLPPLFWGMVKLLSRPPKPPPPKPTSGIVTALMAAVAKETPWVAIIGAGIGGAAEMFLNRNKPKK